MADTPIRPNAPSQYRDTHAAANALAPELRDAFLSAIRALDTAAASALLRAVALGDPESALAALRLDQLPARLSAFTTLLRRTAEDAANRALLRMLVQVGRTATIAVNLTGGLPTEEIRRWAESYGGALIRDISEETRRAVQGIITDAIHAGRSPQVTADLIEQVVGLNRRQTAALLRYRSALEAEGLAGTRLERLVARYSARLLRQRATAIARTETITAANRGQLETWQRNIREGVLRSEAWLVEWIAVDDPRLCPDCEAMDGQRVRIGQPFVSPAYGEVMGPALHPACRCATALVRA